MKQFKTRDGATAFLRKLGIPKQLYNNYILVVDDVISVKDELAKKFRDTLKEKELGVTKSTKPVKEPKQESEKPTSASRKNGRSVSKRCQELILAGKANSEIWAIIKDEFELDDSKKYYPAWNRSNMIRQGKLKADEK